MFSSVATDFGSWTIIKMHKVKIITIIINKWNEIETKSNNEMNKKK